MNRLPNRTTLPALLGLTMVLGGWRASSTPDDGERIELVTRGLGLEAVAVTRSETLPESARARIAEATELELRAVDRGELFHGKVRHEGAEKEVRLAVVPFELDDEPWSALLALDAEGNWLHAEVVDAKGTVVVEWRHSLDSFPFYELPKLEGARPRSFLSELYEELQRKDASKDDRFTLALIHAVRHMQGQAAAFNLPREGRVLGAAETSEKVQSHYAELGDLTQDLAPLLGTSSEEFLRLAKDSAEAAGKMAEAARSRDRESRSAARKKLLGNCKACHGMELPGQLSELKGAFATAREERGVGDGYYQVGHDVRITHHDRERLQALADALRLAALLADADSRR